MTSDIIEQMRSLDRDAYDWFAVVDKAAAEIERLRASLNTISHLADDEETMGCSGYDHEQMHMAIAIARRALEQKP